MKALNLTMTCCIVLVGLTTACNPQKNGESAINAQEEEVKTPSLHGGWTNISMTVEIKTEPDTVIEVPVGNGRKYWG